ncbi:hypothetical protein [Amycolatopsis sp. NPDC004378]
MGLTTIAAAAAACGTVDPDSGAPDPNNGDQTGHYDHSQRWVVEGVEYSGAKIGMPGVPPGRHFVTCVRLQDYHRDWDGPKDWPWREVTVSQAEADRIGDLDATAYDSGAAPIPCPEGDG